MVKPILTGILRPLNVVVLVVLTIVGTCINFAVRVTRLENQSVTQAGTLETDLESLRKKISDLRSELSTQASETEKQIQTQRKRPIPWQAVSSSIVAVGVQWQESSGKINHAWNGTGFAFNGAEYFVSAAHVIKWAENLQENLGSKGLKSQAVVRLPDATIATVQQFWLDPRYRGTSSDGNEPSFDLALFKINPPASILRLPVSKSSPEIGEEVFIAGFPADAPHIQYPDHPKGVFVPTIRCGRVERIVDIGDLTKSSKKNLLQLNIPLVGGFSGSPIVNIDGEVVGVAIFATHRLLRAREIQGAIPTFSDTTRILDPAHVSFAVRTTELSNLNDIAKLGSNKSEETANSNLYPEIMNWIESLDFSPILGK